MLTITNKALSVVRTITAHPTLEESSGLRIAQQRERGYASQQPEFILRRPKVLVTE